MKTIKLNPNFTSEDLAHQIRNVSDGRKYDFKISGKIQQKRSSKSTDLII